MQGSPPAHRTPRPCLRTTGQNWHGTLYPQGAMTSWSNRLLGPETRPCVQSESHSYSRFFLLLSSTEAIPPTLSLSHHLSCDIERHLSFSLSLFHHHSNLSSSPPLFSLSLSLSRSFSYFPSSPFSSFHCLTLFLLSSHFPSFSNSLPPSLLFFSRSFSHSISSFSRSLLHSVCYLSLPLYFSRTVFLAHSLSLLLSLSFSLHAY